MAREALSTIDDYEVFLTEKMTGWTARQRVALAAALAEHWLPAYEAFSAEEEWGDPASLRRTLEAVWGHVEGRALGEADRARHLGQLQDSTPHMDDFDAPEALTACMVLHEAVECCGPEDRSMHFAVRTALGAFEGMVEDWPVDPAGQRRVWQKAPLRKELQAQLKVVEQVDGLTAFDPEAIRALRGRIAGLKTKPPARPKARPAPGLTNQAAFEQYRRFVESDLKGQVQNQPASADPFLVAMTYFGAWFGRYSRRLQTLNGSYGKLADEAGQCALVARNQACDAAVTGPLEWDPSVREIVALSLANNALIKVLDAGTIEAPHSYGPSLRRLWLEAKQQGLADDEAWQRVRIWASHRPAAWEAEGRRKKKGLAHAAPELGEKLAHELTWNTTGDPRSPWATECAGQDWRIRVNDFPDDLLYSLLIGGENAGDFHDWPETWRR